MDEEGLPVPAVATRPEKVCERANLLLRRKWREMEVDVEHPPQLSVGQVRSVLLALDELAAEGRLSGLLPCLEDAADAARPIAEAYESGTFTGDALHRREGDFVRLASALRAADEHEARRRERRGEDRAS